MRKKLISILLFCSVVIHSQTAAQFASIELYYQELRSMVDSLIGLKPDLITKKVYGTSTLGRECFAVKISDNVNVNEAEPEVAFDAGSHADEWVAMGLVNKLMRDLIREYDTDSTIRNLVNSREIWIYPKLLIDGNGRQIRIDGTYYNINRDWGFGTLPNTPFELEYTRYCAEWLLENRFVYHWSGHDGQEDIRYFNSLDVDHYKFLALRYKSFAQYLEANGGYVDPSLGRSFSYGVMGTLSFVSEVNIAKNAVDSIAPRYAVHKPAFLEMIKLSGNGIRGLVTDNSNGAVVKTAQIWVRDTANRILKPVFNHPEVGDYHKYLIPGRYKVWVSAGGYVASDTVSIIVTDEEAADLNFTLTPNSAGEHYGFRTLVKMTSIPEQTERATMVDTWKHLGQPDGLGYRQGRFGYVVIDMGNTFYNLSDNPDFKIYEAAPSGFRYKVDVSMNWLGPWTTIGTDSGTATFDIAVSQVDSFRYIKVTDDGSGDSLVATSSFTLDAVEVFTNANGNTGATFTPIDMRREHALTLSPNPVSDNIIVNYTLSSLQRVDIVIYKLNGERITSYNTDINNIGINTKTMSLKDTRGKSLPNGIYVLGVKAKDRSLYTRFAVCK